MLIIENGKIVNFFKDAIYKDLFWKELGKYVDYSVHVHHPSFPSMDDIQI